MRHTDRRVHRVLRLVVAVLACAAAFAALLALLDTAPRPGQRRAEGPAGNASRAP